MTASSISLLIPTYNRADVIEHIWASWLALRGLTQIVLVNDGSSQDYQPLVSRIRTAAAAADVEFVYLQLRTRAGSPAAKNAGLALCSGDFILTTDDDITLDPEMAERLLTHSLQLGSRAVTGARVVYPKNGESAPEALRRSQAVTGIPYFHKADLTVVPWLESATPLRTPFVTAVALWPAILFREGLRYFEGYGGNGYREETDPQITAQSEYNASIWYCGDAVCYHLPPALAYGQRSGQRRGNRLWFEYWVLRNNQVFMARHGAYLARAWQISPPRATLGLLSQRLGWRRLLTACQKLKACQK